MNFDYSEEQKILKSEVRRYLEANCKPERVRRVLEDGSLGHDAELWAGVIEQGWLAVALPEDYGGVGFGRIELCAIAEELGRACAPLPFGSTLYFLAEALLLAGSPEQCKTWLTTIGRGEVIGCLSVSEMPGPVEPKSVKTRFDGGCLHGTKLPVTDGDSATLALVLAQDEAGLSLYLAPLDESTQREPITTLDPTRGVAKLTFNSAAAERLGPAGEGLALLDSLLERAAVYFAFEQLGGADRCLEMARDYAVTRYAFGRPIGSNQAIKHKLADIYVKNELARSHAYYGAWALAVEAPELSIGAAAARVAGSEAFWFAAKEMIQTFGGIGTTWEADCHLYYRRAQQLALVAGAPAVWKQKLVSALEKKVA
jgi:alkylation response protein AidB-like acyl-CoA dehydrogenase